MSIVVVRNFLLTLTVACGGGRNEIGNIRRQPLDLVATVRVAHNRGFVQRTDVVGYFNLRTDIRAGRGEPSAPWTSPLTSRLRLNLTSTFVAFSSISSTAPCSRTESLTTSHGPPDCLCHGWIANVRLNVPLVVVFFHRVSPSFGNIATHAPAAGLPSIPVTWPLSL